MRNKLLITAIFLISFLATTGIGQVRYAQPRYLGRLAADPATCSLSAPTWYWNTTTNKFKYCSAANVFSDIGGSITTGTTTSSGTNNTFLKTVTGVVQSSLATEDATGNLTIADTKAYSVGTVIVITSSGAGGTVTVGSTGRTDLFASTFVLTKIGANLESSFDADGLWTTSTNQIGFSNSATDPTAAKDTGLGRLSAGVIKSTNGGTTITSLIGGGAAIASAAAMPVPVAYLYHVTGTTNITSITSTNLGSGVCIIWIFDGILTVTDNGTTLNTAGNFVTAANSTMSLCYDGTNWREIARSAN